MSDSEGRTLRRPAPAEAAETATAALSRGAAVSVVGECNVVSGNGSGATAVRHLLVKADGSMVVHGRAGPAPTWTLAAGSDLEVTAEGDHLRLKTLDGPAVEFTRVDVLASFELDGDEAAGQDRERGGHDRLADRLLAQPDLVEPGFRALSTERDTAAGPIDVFGRDTEGHAVVVEVKAQRAGPAAVGQLDRYVAALQRDLHADAEVRGVLVAPSATERTRALLEERGYGFAAVAPER